MTTELKIGRRDVRITHEDRVVFPEAGLTKLDLARHYERVAPAMLPYVRGRPLALQAFPDGIEGDGYFMKAVPRYFPEWVKRATVPKKGGTITHVLAAGRGDARVPDRPERGHCAHMALARRQAAPARPRDARLRPVGRRICRRAGGGARRRRPAARRRAGPVRDDHGLPRASTWCARCGADPISPRFTASPARSPRRWSPTTLDHLTLEWHKAERGDRIYVDVNRIAYAQHAVAPYAVRPRPTAPVAVPLHWEELSDKSLRPDGWTVANVGDRLEAGDPWEGMSRRARSLPRKN